MPDVMLPAIRRALLLAIAPGGYALLCSLTDTWREVPPSQHIMCMALGVIGAAIAMIVAEGSEDGRG